MSMEATVQCVWSFYRLYWEGLKERIAQSHTTGNEYPIIDRLLRPLFHKLVTKRLCVRRRCREVYVW